VFALGVFAEGDVSVTVKTVTKQIITSKCIFWARWHDQSRSYDFSSGRWKLGDRHRRWSEVPKSEAWKAES